MKTPHYTRINYYKSKKLHTNRLTDTRKIVLNIQRDPNN